MKEQIFYLRNKNDETKFTAWDYEKKAPVGASCADLEICAYDVEKIYGSFAQLAADKTLSAGDRVGTQSYYEGAGKGAAVYEICTEGDLATENGLFAKLVPFELGDERIITPEQLGAYGDGESADHIALEKAFNYEGANVIELESAVYLQKDTIKVTAPYRTINGKGARICNKYVDKETEDPINNDLIIGGEAENYLKGFTLCNLELFCSETNGVGVLYRRADHFQFEAHFVDGLVVRNCRFLAPDAPETHVSIVNIRTSKNTVFENNTIINLSKSTCYSGGLWCWSDFKYKTENLTIRNNYVEKTSHDEVVAFFVGEFDGILFENNTVYTHDEPAGHGSHHSVGLGVWDCPTTVKNAIFRNNKFNVVVKNDWMMFSNVQNTKVYNNEVTITGNSPEEPINYGVFRVTCIAENYKKAGIANVSQSNIEIFGNKIKARNTKEIPLNFNCGEGFDIHDNEYTFELIAPEELGRA